MTTGNSFPLRHAIVALVIAAAASRFPAAIAQTESKAAAPTTVEEMTSQYESGMAAGMAKVKAMTGEQLAKPVSFFGIMDLPAVMYLQFLSNHSIHHRGQLSTYLRAMNAHVPSIYGGSADEPFQASAQA